MNADAVVAIPKPRVDLPCLVWHDETNFRLAFGTPEQLLAEVNAGAIPKHMHTKSWLKRQCKQGRQAESIVLEFSGGSPEYMEALKSETRPLDYLANSRKMTNWDVYHE